MTILEDRIEADLALGEQVQLVSELTGLVTEYPLRERLRGQLMIALYLTGRQADALAVFHAGRRLLAEELGVDPGAALLDIHQAILTNDLALKFVPSTDPVTADGSRYVLRPKLLPSNIIDFAGRDKALDGLVSMLTSRDTRAPATLQISGMAGVGKTSVAIRAAYTAKTSFPDGQLYAELTTPGGRRAAPETILLSLLRALGLTDPEIPGELGARVHLYRSLIADRRILLLLDGAVDEQQIEPLLPTGQDCRTIITSHRELPSPTGTHAIRLGVLASDGGIAMLTRIVGEGPIAADPESARKLIALCGGLPLALRVVGTRLCARPHWTLATVAHRLTAAGSRLDELSLGSMDVRARIRSSYRHLDRRTRAAFARLGQLDEPAFTVQDAVLPLGLSEHAAEEIVESLVDARMLGAVISPQTGVPHYRFHELFRLFAREQGMPDERMPFRLSGNFSNGVQGEYNDGFDEEETRVSAPC